MLTTLYTQIICMLAGLSTGILIGFVLCSICMQRSIMHCTLNTVMMLRGPGPPTAVDARSDGKPPLADKEMMTIKGLGARHEARKRKKKKRVAD